MNKLNELRKEIDLIDAEIVKQLNRRFEAVLKIRKLKKEKELPVEDLAREEEIISRLDHRTLDEQYIRDIYRIIFHYSKSGF